MSSSEASQQAYKIANILKPDPVALDGLLQNPRLLAESLGKKGSYDPSWPKTLQRLWHQLSDNQEDANSFIFYANYGKEKGPPKSQLEDAYAQIALSTL